MIIKINAINASGGNSYDSVHIDGAVVPDMVVVVSGVAKDVIKKIYQAGKDGQELEIIVGVKIDKYYASEIEKHAIAITQYNHPDTIQVGNMYGIDYSNIKDIDLVLGGSPCTHWSIAKKGRETSTEGLGFELFMKYVNAVRVLKPKYFLYENNHSIHEDIRNSISGELGVFPIFINSASVSAQNRKRLYWTNIPVVGLSEDRGIYLKDIIEENADEKDYMKYAVITNSGKEKLKSNTIRVGGAGSGIENRHNWDTIRVGQIGKGGQGQRIYSDSGKSGTLCANGGGAGAKTGGLYAISSRGRYLVDGKRVDIKGATTEQRLETSFSEKMNCLTTVQKDSLLLDMDNWIIRKLSCVECERLQTLPDDYTKYGLYDGVVKEVAKTNRLKCIGNGWTAEVIAWFLKFMEV